MLDYKHNQHGDQDTLKGKTIVYKPAALKQLGVVAQHDHRLRTLPFGAIKIIRKLRLNCKKIKSKRHKRTRIQQHGINVKDIVWIQ